MWNFILFVFVISLLVFFWKSWHHTTDLLSFCLYIFPSLLIFLYQFRFSFSLFTSSFFFYFLFLLFLTFFLSLFSFGLYLPICSLRVYLYLFYSLPFFVTILFPLYFLHFVFVPFLLNSVLFCIASSFFLCFFPLVPQHVKDKSVLSGCAQWTLK